MSSTSRQQSSHKTERRQDRDHDSKQAGIMGSPSKGLRHQHDSRDEEYKRRDHRNSTTDDRKDIGYSKGDNSHRSRDDGKDIRKRIEAREKAQPGSTDRGPSVARTQDEKEEVPVVEPDYTATGNLLRDTNTRKGVLLKYTEPPEARVPLQKYRFFVFKGKNELDALCLHSRSCFLFGRERLVCDVPVDHPSASKQHAVLQYRQYSKKNEYGDRIEGVKPYLLDLDSANGTFLNGDRIDGRRYYELQSGDLVKFGQSTRDYVLMLEEP